MTDKKQNPSTLDCSLKLLRVFDILRGLDPNIQAQTVTVFLLIAQRGPITAKHLAERVGTTQPSISRNLAALAGSRRIGRPGGMGLIELHPDPYETRRLVARLTAKGHSVMAQIQEVLDDVNGKG